MTGNSTIFAPATGPGRGAIAIIRISGDRTASLIAALTGSLPEPRRAAVRTLRASTGEILDRGLVLWFPRPRSYTGEDLAELHVHAGPAIIEAVSDTLQAGGARPATAGEFTQRAFLNGRLDLIEAEGIADLIEAETQAQRRQALAQSGGELGAIYRGWTSRLRRIVAIQEAAVDFPEETDAARQDDSLLDDIRRLQAEFEGHLEEGHKGELLRRGVQIAVIGRPNVGKSSLVNALSRRDVAIVSRIAGTTRDVLEARIVLAEIPITLLDTAGLRATEDDLEQEGVRRARQAADRADLILHVTCGGERRDSERTESSIWVANKVDLTPPPEGAIGVSATTGQGLDELEDVLAAAVRHLAGSGFPVMTRARHRDCIGEAANHLRIARQLSMPELVGEELRLALHHLGRLTGVVRVEDILGEIFSNFCIGK